MATNRTHYRTLQKTAPADNALTGETFTAYALIVVDRVEMDASDTFYVAGPSSPDIETLFAQFAVNLDGQPTSPRNQQELSDFVNWLTERGFVRLQDMVVLRFGVH
jgi:hypothetical protein